MLPSTFALTLCCFFQSLTIEQLHELVAAREAALNHIKVEVESTGFITRNLADPLNDADWESIPTPIHRDLITIARPSFFHQDFIDGAPTPAYETSFCNGVLVRLTGHRMDDGKQIFDTVPNTAAMRYLWCPLLMPFDLAYPDNQQTGATLLALFDQGQVEWVGSKGDVNKVTATLQQDGFRQEYQFEINARGTPLRAVITNRRDTGERIGSWTMQVRGLTDFLGEELPEDVVIVVHLEGSPVPWDGVHQFSLLDAQPAPDATAENLCIPIERCNAVVRDYADGQLRVYDASGAVVYQNKLGMPTADEEGEQSASHTPVAGAPRNLLAWSGPAGALLLAAGGLLAFCRRTGKPTS